MKKFLLALLLVTSVSLHGQSGVPFARGASLPVGACDLGQLFILHTIDGVNGVGLYFCSNVNGTWNKVGWTTSAVPQGGIIFVASGACPTSYTEVTSLNGKMFRGTVSGNTDVGGTGGADSVTPVFTGSSGTIPAETFTGSSATSSAVSAGTPAGTNGATATSGNCAATNLAIGTGATTACKATAPNLTVPAETFTGSALATHTHTLTATGTNGTVSFTPAGTIAAVDNRPAYIKLIGCSKD